MTNISIGNISTLSKHLYFFGDERGGTGGTEGTEGHTEGGDFLFGVHGLCEQQSCNQETSTRNLHKNRT